MHFFCRLNATLIIFLRFSNRKMTTTIILLLVCVQCRSFFLETLQQKWIPCVQNLFWFYRICQRISFVCVFLLDLFDLTFASSFRNFSVSLSRCRERLQSAQKDHIHGVYVMNAFPCIQMNAIQNFQIMRTLLYAFFSLLSCKRINSNTFSCISVTYCWIIEIQINSIFISEISSGIFIEIFLTVQYQKLRWNFIKPNELYYLVM